MFRYKVQKKTMIIAAMVILLCLVSITGATFALFTSNVDDGKVGINATSGNLKVDIIDDSDDPSTLIGEVLDLIPKDGRTEILFEPGATYHTEGFRVKNNGNIPFNYIIYISSDENVPADFFDAFDVWITSDVTDKTKAVPIEDFERRLEVGLSSDIYYLVFQMKPSAGNTFQERIFTGVGVTVCAVQGNVHFDED